MKVCPCGKRIEFVLMASGQHVPVDLSAPVIQVMKIDGLISGHPANRKIGGRPAYLVSHFATCPQSGTFSNSKNAHQVALDMVIEQVHEIVEQHSSELLKRDTKWTSNLLDELVERYKRLQRPI